MTAKPTQQRKFKSPDGREYTLDELNMRNATHIQIILLYNILLAVEKKSENNT